MDFEALQALLTTKQAAEYLQSIGVEIAQDTLRGLARKDKVPGTVKVLGKVGFDKAALDGWTPPESKVVSRREDGRRPYKIYLLPEEKVQIEELGVGEFYVKKPRKSKATVEAVEATEAGQDPFEAFGA